MDRMTKEERSRNMAAIKGRNTEPELYLRRLLFGLGMRYRVSPSDKEGHPDIWLAKYNAVIFVNGCFWHAHAGCRNFRIPSDNKDFWEDKLRKNKERDLNVYRNLLTEGHRVLVVWECLIRQMKKNQDVRTAVLLDICGFLSDDILYQELSWSYSLREVVRTLGPVEKLRATLTE